MKIAFPFVSALALALSVAPAGAYQVAPMIYDLAPSGQRATNVLRVQNDSEKPITIEMVAEKRTFDEKGNEKRTPADDDFVLFPPQAVIAPQATQAIRVQYIGAPTLDKSETYTITVKQVPVDLPAAGPSGVQFVFNFSTLANVVPTGAKAMVETVSFAPVENGYALRLKNNGNKYANLAISKVTLTQAGKTSVIEGEGWRKLLGSSWILPGLERVIILPKTEGEGVPTAKFELVESAQ